MKKVSSFLFTLLFVMVLFSGVASAAGKLTVTQEAFYVLPFLDYNSGYVYAEVENTGDKPVGFNGGLLELFDADGNSIESTNLYSCYPEVLQPGEKGYLNASQSVEEAKEASFIADYMLTVTGKGNSDQITLRFPVTAKYETVDESYWKVTYVTATVENNTDKTYYNYTAVFALKDKEGKLLYVTACYPSYIGLLPGTKVEVRTQVDSDTIEYFDAKGIIPEQIEAIVYVTVDKE